jgi:hypothetical protein
MDFVIVANDDLAPLGRELAHGISVQKAHSGSFWTVKAYKDNEAQFGGKQPVIFLGDNEVARAYADILPERFRGFSTRCSFEGAKVVLIADDPGDVSNQDIASLKRIVGGTQEELRQRATSTQGVSESGALGATETSSFAASIGAALWPLVTGIFSEIIFIVRFLSARKRKQEYRKLQYQYVLSRFLKDEFEIYIEGVEGYR